MYKIVKTETLKLKPMEGLLSASTVGRDIFGVECLTLWREVTRCAWAAIRDSVNGPTGSRSPSLGTSLQYYSVAYEFIKLYGLAQGQEQGQGLEPSTDP